MPDTDIGSASEAGLRNVIVDYSVDAEQTDGPGDQKEYTYQLTKWADWLGYYKNIPELQVAIDAKANWTVGNGYEADNPTKLILSRVRGNGKDTFNTILSNSIRVYTIGGDSFAEVIRDDNGDIFNLKPLDPSSMVIVANNKGQIIRYEQVSKTKTPNKRYKPHQILHLSRKRIADEIHGISVVPSVEWIILARNEAMADWKATLHWNLKPRFIFHLDTDDTTQIAAFKVKMDAAYKDGENLYVPKGTVVPELVAVSGNSTMNPLTWINQLNDYFFQCVNVPQIIVGNAKEFTDASSKIVYLSYEQSVKEEQLYVEEQLEKQLNIVVQLTFPASLQNDLLAATAKDPNMAPSEPNDQVLEMEGRE